MPRHTLSAFASAATHAAALLLVYLTIQVARQTTATSPDTFDTTRLEWVPDVLEGGGRKGGGDESTMPPRQAKAPGRDETSMATRTDRSIDSAIDSPIETTPIAARPMGDAMAAFAGAVIGERAGDSLGPNTGPGGDGDGRGNSPFDGARAGGPGVTTPVAITRVKPQYTPDAMRAKVQGVAIVECVVLPDGTVGDARIRRSLDPTFGLDQQALAAAKKWRFKPGLLNGTPVPVIVSIELTFTLR
jgi:protein TonB